jgi:hypothetical protein
MNSSTQQNNDSHPTHHKLPAVKLILNKNATKSYSNPIKLSEEVFNHKKIHKEKIKFISIKDNIVFIATDDEDTHNELSKPWPLEAFDGQSRLLQNKPRKQSTNNEKTKTETMHPHILHLLGIHKDIDINNEQLQQVLNEHDLQSPTRLTNKKGLPIDAIQVTAGSEESYKTALISTISLFYQRVKCTPPPKPIKQCFKCQLKDHTKYECKNGTRCLRCGGQHNYKTEGETTCPSNAKTRCVNCGDSHFACSRQCRYLNEPDFVTINPENKKQHSSTRIYSTAKPTDTQIYCTQAQLEAKFKSLQEEITTFKETAIATIREEAIQTIKESLINTNDPFIKHLTNEINEIFKTTLEKRLAQMSSHLLEKITERLDPICLKQQSKPMSNTTPASTSSTKSSTKPPTKPPTVDLNNNSINQNESNTTPVTHPKVNQSNTNSNSKNKTNNNLQNLHKNTLDSNTISPIVINSTKRT